MVCKKDPHSHCLFLCGDINMTDCRVCLRTTGGVEPSDREELANRRYLDLLKAVNRKKGICGLKVQCAKFFNGAWLTVRLRFRARSGRFPSKMVLQVNRFSTRHFIIHYPFPLILFLSANNAPVKPIKDKYAATRRPKIKVQSELA